MVVSVPDVPYQYYISDKSDEVSIGVQKIDIIDI